MTPNQNLKKYYYFEVSSTNKTEWGLLYGEYDNLLNRLQGNMLLYTGSPFIYLSKSIINPFVSMEIEATNSDKFKRSIMQKVDNHSQTSNFRKAYNLIFDQISKNEPPAE